MIVFARMGLDTPRLQVVYGMVIAGLGMGCCSRSIRSRFRTSRPGAKWGRPLRPRSFFDRLEAPVGVAAFGSIMLTRYHREFAQRCRRKCHRPRCPTSRTHSCSFKYGHNSSGVQPRAGRSCAAATAVCEREDFARKAGCT